MCVIVYKPAGQPVPSWETLESCWSANPDGAGFMRPDGGAVRIAKGFMEWESFAGALAAELEHFDALETPLALHFRIATHGAVTPGCCHPFPVCGSASQMRATEQRADVGFMHNGILQGLTTSERVSDSMAFDKAVLEPLAALAGELLASEEALRVIGSSTQGSRFLLMDGAGRVQTFGRWTAIDGILYSNDRFAQRPRLTTPWDEGGRGEQTSLLDALCAFGDPSYFGMFPVCKDCELFADCAEYLPCCSDEQEAERYAGTR